MLPVKENASRLHITSQIPQTLLRSLGGEDHGEWPATGQQTGDHTDGAQLWAGNELNPFMPFAIKKSAYRLMSILYQTLG